MPATAHVEKHFTGGAWVRDVVIGMSDGLTVPFALAAGLSSTLAASHLVVTAGLAEIAAGSLAMGLGGYLAARSEAEHYDSERRREVEEVHAIPDVEAEEVERVFAEFGLTPDEVAPLVAALRRNPKRWVEFMMRFELGLEKPNPKRALASAVTIAVAYIVGGLVPLLPYVFIAASATALRFSVAGTLLALVLFGGVKGRLTGAGALRSALSTTMVGALAAAAAFGLARLAA